jgi:hypothetical protein
MKKILGSLLLAVALLIGGVWLYLEFMHWLPRTDLPEFDQKKASLLSPEKRKAYEQELFSELFEWNQVSVRYPSVADIAKREQRWFEMAADGFELAHITLQVLSPTSSRVYALSGALERAKQLAQAGDVGAMCLMKSLSTAAAAEHAVSKYHQENDIWLAKGARAGHPQCQIELAVLLSVGVRGFKQDTAQFLDLEFQARRAGYVHDLLSLLLHFESRSKDSPSDARRGFCWRQVYEQYKLYPSNVATDHFLYELRTSGKKDFVDLANELTNAKFNLNDCLALGKGN